jgi:hypothetical protein
MKRPRIYGSETNCRAAVARYIEAGRQLLDEASGVRKRVESARARRPSSLEVFVIEAEWAGHFRQWMKTTGRGMSRYLQEQLEEVTPFLAAGLPPDTGKPRHHIGLDNGVPWLKDVLDELHEVRAALGVSRGVAQTAPPAAKFEELRASGLVDHKVISDHAREMASPRTPRQLSNAIGSAKELTEATLRQALDQLGGQYSPGDSLPVLMGKWRDGVATRSSLDPKGQRSLDRAQSALANLVTFLAEWRNVYGRGHGRSRYPPGLKERHARLAADAAETCVRFIVNTMDDLQLLPP